MVTKNQVITVDVMVGLYLTLRGKYIVFAYFDATMMEYCIGESKLDYKNRKNDPDINKPDKFSYRKWVSW